MRPGKAKRIAVVGGVLAVVVLGVGTGLAWPHLVFWNRFEPLGTNAQGLLEYRHRKTGIVMVRVPGGTFLMGSPESEKGRWANEGPVHEVKLSPFLVGKYEITQTEWRRVAGTNPSRVAGEGLAVEAVSWNECSAFCRETGLRLPTEAQWECACRAGTTTPFAFGATITSGQVRYDPHDLRPIEPDQVASFPPNAFGLHQMHGNVAEWCEDVFDSTFYSKPAATGPDPVSRAGSDFRVVRGAPWSAFPVKSPPIGTTEFLSEWCCRSAFRLEVPPEANYPEFGFRAAYYPLP